MKININCVLDNSTVNHCKKVNRKIKEYATNEIDFSNNTCRPHITLLMGQIEDENIEKVKEIVSGIDFKCLENKVVFDKPVVENNYIMLNVKNIDAFKKDCDVLIEKLGDYIKPSKYTISHGTATPHITLGFSKNVEKASDYINGLENFKDAKLQNVEVSPAGKYGIVLLQTDNGIN